MATIKTSLMLYDGMSRKLDGINASVDRVAKSFGEVDRASKNGLDTSMFSGILSSVKSVGQHVRAATKDIVDFAMTASNLKVDFNNLAMPNNSGADFTSGFMPEGILDIFAGNDGDGPLMGLGAGTDMAISYNDAINQLSSSMIGLGENQNILNNIMLANPIMWMSTLIGLLVFSIYWLAGSMTVLQSLWLAAMNILRLSWNKFVIGFLKMGYAVMIFLMKLKLTWMLISMAIVGYVIDMYIQVITWLENMVNTSIKIINAFITALNSIPGVSIPLINEVSIAAGEAAKAEAIRQAMLAGAKEYEGQIAAAGAVFSANIAALEISSLEQQANRERETADLSGAARGASIWDNYYPSALDEINNNTRSSANNTQDMRDSMALSSEELKYLRDLAEQEAVNRFTTASINIEMNNSNNINSDMDIDGVVDELESRLSEAMNTAAEGVYV